MRIKDIRERLSNGFEVFRLRLTVGRRIDAPHPDFIAVVSMSSPSSIETTWRAPIRSAKKNQQNHLHGLKMMLMTDP
jgi:hypothetical protein